MFDLSIIIVSWNCRDYLEQCLHSIANSDTRCSYEIIIVDNGSRDNTIQFLRDKYPAAQLIENQMNIGFAAANNQAFKFAKGRNLLLLNPDTIINTGALDVMIDCMEQQSNVWAIGPSILNKNNTIQQAGVRFPNNWNIFSETLFLDKLFPKSKLFGKHKELYENPSKPRFVDYLQGSCFMVRSDVLRKIGGLDEKYFMYFEETDWCYRIRQNGGSVYYCPGAQVVHFGGGEFGHYDEQRLIHYHTSLLYFYHKHCSKIKSIMLRVILILRSVIRVIMWFMIGMIKSSRRKIAFSSFRGYGRVLFLLFNGRKE